MLTIIVPIPRSRVISYCCDGTHRRYGFNTMVADQTTQLLFAAPLLVLSFFVLL